MKKTDQVGWPTVRSERAVKKKYANVVGFQVVVFICVQMRHAAVRARNISRYGENPPYCRTLNRRREKNIIGEQLQIRNYRFLRVIFSSKVE